MATAVTLGLEALALTDHHGLYGAVRFAEAARALGMPSVFGAELTLSGGGPRTGVPDPHGAHLDRARAGPRGYAALSSLLADAHLALGEKGCATVALDELAERHGGPLARAHGVPQGPRARRARRARPARGAPRARPADLGARARPTSPSSCGTTATRSTPRATTRSPSSAIQAGVDVVATNNVHYATPASFRLASTLAAVRARRCVDEMEGWTSPAPVACLRSRRRAGSAASRGSPASSSAPASSRSTARSTCASSPRGSRTSPPPTGSTSRATSPSSSRWAPPSATARAPHERVAGAWAQLDHELSVIGQLGYAGYFLIVWDLTQFCRREDIYCQGRGSAANSAVCYALGVTNADAVSLGLLFERFLSPARDGPPDIDVDIESGRREEVIQYVYARYGRRHAAQVANVITYRPRSAVRDVARALGDTAESALEAAARVERRWGHDHEVLDDEAAAAAGIAPLVAALATEALGRPRHLGLHSAGMVICDRPVVEVCPVEWARMEGRSVLQWDKDDCAAIGLVKFDLLGLGMLDALHRTVDLVRAATGEAVDLATAAPGRRGLRPVVLGGHRRGLPGRVARADGDAAAAAPAVLLRPRDRGRAHPSRPDPGQRGQPVPAPPPRRGAGRATCTRSSSPSCSARSACRCSKSS